jgi:hypothetical protein
VIAYKFLRPDGRSPFSGFRWEIPDAGPGRWIDAPVDPCRSGIHACRLAHLPFWLGESLYEIELEGEIVEQRSKLVASRGRLVRRLERWDDELRDAFTRNCADRARELASSASPPLGRWSAMVEPSIPEGPGLLGFIAARIAEEISGPDAYRQERRRQAEWLAEGLGLSLAAD